MEENSTASGICWGEIEYGSPSGSRIRKEREAYEQAEREEHHE